MTNLIFEERILKNGLIMIIEEKFLTDGSQVFDVSMYKKVPDGIRRFATNSEAMTYEESVDISKNMEKIFNVLEIEL